MTYNDQVFYGSAPPCTMKCVFLDTHETHTHTCVCVFFLRVFMYVHIYAYIYMYIYIYIYIDRKKPPPPGGLCIYYVPGSRAVCKRFHDDMRPSHLVVKSLTHSSWSGNIVNRKPPRGGGFLSINIYTYIHVRDETRTRRTWSNRAYFDEIPLFWCRNHCFDGQNNFFAQKSHWLQVFLMQEMIHTDQAFYGSAPPDIIPVSYTGPLV